MPCVSVIVPTYNHAAFIGQTLDSVFDQTFNDFEIIVINDGSPDCTGELLKPMADGGRIRYFEQPNSGQASARNRGLREARGEFIALLDDDDVWPPDKLEWQVAALREHPEWGAVAGDRYWWDGGPVPELTRPETGPRLLTFEALFGCNPLASPGQVLIRRSLIDSLGGFNPELWGSDDYDLWFRVTRVSQFAVYDRIALLYRAHATNASNNLDRMLVNTRRVIHAHAMAADGAEMPRLLQTANRWVYDYLGSRLVARFQDELSHLRLRAAFRSGRSISSFAEWGWTDQWLVGRFLREMFPVRRLLLNCLPGPLIGWIRAIKRVSHPRSAKQEEAKDPSCVSAAE